MKKRVRFGLRMNLPFGLFPHAATIADDFDEEDAEELRESLTKIQNILIRNGKGRQA